MRILDIALAGLCVFVIGCHHSPGNSTGNDMSIGHGDGGLTSSCAPPAHTCNVDADCCVGSCDPGTHSCVIGGSGGSSGGSGCLAGGVACTSSVQCCGLSCSAGVCAGVCVQNGSACKVGGDCCSGNCASNSCAAINATGCTTDNNACSTHAECCSKNCKGGVCITTAAGCQPLGDVCFSGTDCCSGNCPIASGMTAGTCAAISTMGNCAMDGEICPGCSACCSRVCAETASGASVCQLASGCRIQGDTCHVDGDCCGAAGSKLPGDGTVKCNIVTGTNPPIGFCTNPTAAPGGMACDPEGDVCGIQPPQACGSNAREDCCECMPPKFNCCKLDKEGVPRCYGGSTMQCPNGYTGTAPCCIQPGQQCTFSNECCGGAPCLPDPNGVLRCGTSCSPPSGACTATSDCCPGLACNVPPGKTQGTCGAVPPPPPPGDMGRTVADGGVCSLVGQSCSSTQPCCSGLGCASASMAGAVCAAGETGCTCFGLIL